jgi:hypothetical protein
MQGARDCFRWSTACRSDQTNFGLVERLLLVGDAWHEKE